ncbi:hypothetical protein FB45DRAFT_865890 [Roridomyces roridus]|uniref:PH domain-containing protein n=1 Tax=Roridomyces roridus TaxID=1738132 RepID=A0AAD7C0B7_9AGAR|nr:hypothetical protein FB45DRAFT_865890 [Roridomyces roridus]
MLAMTATIESQYNSAGARDLARGGLHANEPSASGQEQRKNTHYGPLANDHSTDAARCQWPAHYGVMESGGKGRGRAREGRQTVACGREGWQATTPGRLGRGGQPERGLGRRKEGEDESRRDEDATWHSCPAVHARETAPFVAETKMVTQITVCRCCRAHTQEILMLIINVKQRLMGPMMPGITGDYYRMIKTWILVDFGHLKKPIRERFGAVPSPPAEPHLGSGSGFAHVRIGSEPNIGITSTIAPAHLSTLDFLPLFLPSSLAPAIMADPQTRALVIASPTASPESSVIPASNGGNPALTRHPRNHGFPGTLDRVYSALGSSLEGYANRAAHTLGLGPAAVTRRLCEYFGEASLRETRLQELVMNGAVSEILEKECAALVKYSLPCLNRSSIEQISVLWERGTESTLARWSTYRDYASVCLADGDLCVLVEGRRSDELVSPESPDGGLCVIDRLLVVVECRYLGGILELRSFWVQTGPSYEILTDKIFVKVKMVLEDRGLDCPDTEEDATGIVVSADSDGIDILCEALLNGLHTWISHKSLVGIVSEHWYQGARQVLQLLRQPKAEVLLPRSWTLANSQDFYEAMPQCLTEKTFDALLATCEEELQGVAQSDQEEDELEDSCHVLALLPTDLPRTTVIATVANFRPTIRAGESSLQITLSLDYGNGQGWEVHKDISQLRKFNQQFTAELKKAGMEYKWLKSLFHDRIWSQSAPRHLNRCKLTAETQKILVDFFTRDVPRAVAMASPADVEGYMLESGWWSGWRIGYYRLHGSTLKSFDRPGGTLRTSIDLKDAVIKPYTWPPRPQMLLSDQRRWDRSSMMCCPYAFRLKLVSGAKKGEKYLFSAESAQEARRWKSSLSMAANTRGIN